MTTTAPQWSTSSDGDAPATKPMELAALGDHVTQCSARSGRAAAVLFGVQTLLGYATARFVTTLAVLATLIGAVLLVI